MSCERYPQEGYCFHPFEIAFCGFSNSGKTSLIEKLVQQLSSTYAVGYVKHDAHAFRMDHEGKDTYRVRHSGADAVFIANASQSALIAAGKLDSLPYLLHNDFVMVEGYSDLSMKKILVIDQKKEILKTNYENVIAYVGQETSIRGLPQPYFHWDDIVGIQDFILEQFEDKIRKTPLYGLVLAGGYSKRMQQDKALLQYYGQPQAEVCYNLLSKYCEKTYLAVRERQWPGETFDHLPKLYDRLLNFGPLGGILTAMNTYREVSWLVVACDLPHLDDALFQELIKGRNPFKMATAFLNGEDHLPEPLCAVYEPKSYAKLFQSLGLGRKCVRKILIQSPLQKLTLSRPRVLENVNEKSHYLQVKEAL